MNELARKRCKPCRGGTPPLGGEQLLVFARQLPGWRVVDEHHLGKTYPFPDFVSGLDFVNAIGRLAEEQGHHPDLQLSWGRVDVKIYTHKIDGLSESDFILAAKIDELRFPSPQ
jgi:4a-hydroxytetrahydrobiopterin dehydratase